MRELCKVGTHLHALVGPMGIPSQLGNAKKVVCVGGGLGVAPVFPQASRYKEAGAYVIGVLGFPFLDLVFWKDKFQSVCDELIPCTNDGSIRGLVTDGLKSALAKHPDIDEVVAIGPPVMMKACADATRGARDHGERQPIMVDGTGMCGGRRAGRRQGEVRLRRRPRLRRPPGRFR